jgi:GNAT superfamily N-acetyltransferase
MMNSFVALPALEVGLANGIRTSKEGKALSIEIIVYRDGVPVGCGALRLLNAETAELNRMYVVPAARGKGLGRRLVAALEAEARALRVRQLVLETGVRKAAALALYQATGFQSIPLYGEYCLSPETSVCLGKELSGRVDRFGVRL